MVKADESAPSGASFNISEIAIKHPVTTVMMIVTLLVLGLISYSRLSVELFPNVSFPIVAITTTYPGASSKEIETLVSKPLEEAVSGINGIEHLRSTSGGGFSTVIIEFKLEKDIKDAANEVRERVTLIRASLPQDIEEPVVARVDPDAAPILNYAVSGPYSLLKLTDMVRDVVKPKLEQIDGVARIDILGGQEREIQVLLDPGLLNKYGMTTAQVASRLKQENLDFPSGQIQTQRSEITLRTLNSFASAEQIAQLPMSLSNGQSLQLQDLGEVRDGLKEIRNRSWLNGQQAVVVAVQKQSGTNTVQVADELTKAVEKLKTQLPQEVKFAIGFDTSRFIVESKDAALEELIVGSLLAVIVIFLFLRTLRGTLIAAIAIPASVISTYTLMYALNFSLNMMSLMALALVVGILVDDAVVDLENIARHIEMGEKPYDAAVKATNEIGLAVVATTFSIVAVFVPIGFMSGIVGQFFKQFGLTVSCAVLVSLLVARTLTPTLAAYWLKAKPEGLHIDESEQASRGMAGLYKDILQWALRHRVITLILAVVIFVLSLPIAGLLPKGFAPKNDRDEFSIAVQLASGSSLEETSAVLQELAKRVATEKMVKSVLVTAGNSRGKTDVGNIGVTLLSKANGRKETQFQIQARLQKITQNIPGALISYREMRVVDDGRGNYALNLSLQGEDLDQLQQISEKLITKLHQMPIVTDTSTSLGTPQQEMHVVVDNQRAAALGVSAAAVASALRVATVGDVASQMRLPNTNVDIRVRMTDTSRYDLSQLRNLSLTNNQGQSIPLDAVATIDYQTGPNTIERFDRLRQVMVYANTLPGSSLSEILGPAEAELKAMKLPPTVKYNFAGDAERMKDSFNSLLSALGIAIIFIYIILASQFEHFLHPFTLMMALPLSFVGAFLALFFTNEELGMMSLIGVVMLMGLVTKNSILLVDYTITLRRQGLNRNEALLLAGPVRLRPILMTTLAMIVGMMPVAMRLTVGSESRAPMAVAVIGGLITSTLLTLVVVPVTYTVMDDILLWLQRLFRWEEPIVAQGLPALPIAALEDKQTAETVSARD